MNHAKTPTNPLMDFLGGFGVDLGDILGGESESGEKYVSAQDLTMGDTLVHPDGTQLSILSIYRDRDDMLAVEFVGTEYATLYVWNNAKVQVVA